MKINIKVFALSYASVSDSNLYVNTIGVYDSVESAEKALKDCVAEDIECGGDKKENWKIVERKAEYVDFFSNEHKQYLIKEL